MGGLDAVSPSSTEEVGNAAIQRASTTSGCIGKRKDLCDDSSCAIPGKKIQRKRAGCHADGKHEETPRFDAGSPLHGRAKPNQDANNERALQGNCSGAP